VCSTQVAEGIQFIEDHIDNQSTVVLLGTEVAKELFDTTVGIIGETIRINGQPFTVLGVLEEEGSTSFGNSDDKVLVPITTALSRLTKRSPNNEVDLIYVQAIDSDSVSSAINEVSQILRAQHISILAEDDFEISSTQSMLDMASSTTDTLTLFLGGIAGVSLLVGGIGIMNIMMISVIERTKEIGLRKAMGARKKSCPCSVSNRIHCA
jgi:putative ABC transport system permease protein